MTDPIPWPFPLPEEFLEQLDYPRVVGAFDSPAMRAQLAQLFRDQRIPIDLDEALPRGPRPFVALWWELAGDELAWSNGAHSGAGQLDHWPCATRSRRFMSVGKPSDRAILRARPHLVRALGVILGSNPGVRSHKRRRRCSPLHPPSHG
jgi:hypothetical protein